MTATTADIPPVVTESLRALIDRLTALLQRECEDLRANRLEGLEEYARQKDLLLLDITRLLSAAPAPQAVAPRLAQELDALRRALHHNRDLIARHLDAAREFAGFVEDAIRRERADGTYSRRAAAPRDAAAEGRAGPPPRVKKAYGKW